METSMIYPPSDGNNLPSEITTSGTYIYNYIPAPEGIAMGIISQNSDFIGEITYLSIKPTLP